MPISGPAERRSAVVDFRCVMLVALWTLLAGPVFGRAPVSNARPSEAVETRAGSFVSGLLIRNQEAAPSRFEHHRQLLLRD
jgi:hypothetical protein